MNKRAAIVTALTWMGCTELRPLSGSITDTDAGVGVDCGSSASHDAATPPPDAAPDGSLAPDAAPDAPPPKDAAPDGSSQRPSPIDGENALPGDTGWMQSFPSGTLGAYADRASYRPGETVEIHAGAGSPRDATWELWRLGYYGGAGGRRLLAGGPVRVPTAADPVMDPATGAVRAPWPTTFSFTIPTNAVTGVYLVKLSADTEQTYAILVVRETSPTAPILFPVAVNTYQAYNDWGGTSLYVNERSDWSADHAYAASFDRPYTNEGTGDLFGPDISFLTFAEGQGYDLAYATDVDVDADPSLALGRRLIVIQGHSEYWSAGMRSAVEGAIAAGENVAFLGGNDCYWQVRYAIGPTGTPRRVLVGYKEYAMLDPLWSTDPAHVTGLWRDPPVNRPENALLGEMSGDWLLADGALTVTAPTSWLWSGAGVAANAIVPSGYGIETDHRFTNGLEPAGVQELAHSLIEDHFDSASIAQTTLYTASSGAQVFDAGSIGWSNGLAAGGFWDRRLQIATANLFSRLAGNGTLGAALVRPLSLPAGAPAPIYRGGVQVSTVTTALSNPLAIAAAPNGGALVVDGDRIVRVDATGAVTPVAGSVAGDQDGPAAQAEFRGPRGLVAAPDGTIFVADTGNHKIKRITTAGDVSTLAGSDYGFANGSGSAAQFAYPMGIVRDASGRLLVADSWNNQIRAVTTAGRVSTFAGAGGELSMPIALALDPDGSLAVVESRTGALKRVGTDGSVTIIAGDMYRLGWQDGPAASASLFATTSVAVRANGEIILLDNATYRVRALRNGTIDTLAGGTTAALVDGPGAQSGFASPCAAAAASDGSLLVVDRGNHALRRLSIP